MLEFLNIYVYIHIYIYTHNHIYNIYMIGLRHTDLDPSPILAIGIKRIYAMIIINIKLKKLSPII